MTADGAQYESIEFTGSGIAGLSMDYRYTVSNMGLEAGAKCVLFPADQRTADYFHMDLKDIDWIYADEDADFDKELSYDLSKLEPNLSVPQGVDNIHGIEEAEGKKVDEVYIGSCTNGSVEDLKDALDILQGKHIAKNVRMIVTPASNKIFKEAAKKGYIQQFIEAGGVIVRPSCALCCGMPYGILSDYETVLSTGNRNFIGRMGTDKTLIYLSSPAVAAASALTGKITDPRKYLKAEKVGE